jgi:hypothetical protein
MGWQSMIIRQAFIDHADLRRTALVIQKIARASRSQIAIGGGLAMQLFGSTSLTDGVDVFAKKDFLSGKQVLPWRNRKKLDFGGSCAIFPGNVPVKVVVREDKYKRLFRSAIANAIHFTDLDVPVISPEYMVAAKMVARRDTDMLDLHFLATEMDLDRKAVDQILLKHLGLCSLEKWRRIQEQAMSEKEREGPLNEIVMPVRLTENVRRAVENLAKKESVLPGEIIRRLLLKHLSGSCSP